VFFGLGSTVFAYLWSHHATSLGRWPGLGLFSSLLVAIVTPAVMAIPSLGAIVIPLYSRRFSSSKFTLGFWLLFKGLHARGEVPRRT